MESNVTCQYLISYYICLLLQAYDPFIYFNIGPGWLNELGSWITKQLIQAYHQYSVGSRPAL